MWELLAFEYVKTSVGKKTSFKNFQSLDAPHPWMPGAVAPFAPPSARHWEKYVLFSYEQTKQIVFPDVSKLENDQFFSYFSRLRRNPAHGLVAW